VDPIPGFDEFCHADRVGLLDAFKLATRMFFALGEMVGIGDAETATSDDYAARIGRRVKQLLDAEKQLAQARANLQDLLVREEALKAKVAKLTAQVEASDELHLVVALSDSANTSDVYRALCDYEDARDVVLPNAVKRS
jgi:hypothetical protein